VKLFSLLGVRVEGKNAHDVRSLSRKYIHAHGESKPKLRAMFWKTETGKQLAGAIVSRLDSWHAARLDKLEYPSGRELLELLNELVPNPLETPSIVRESVKQFAIEYLRGLFRLKR